MEFSQLSMFILLSVALVATHAALPPEVYWKSKLPNTPMPKAITDLLHPTDWTEDKSTSVAVGKGGVNVDTAKPKPNGSGTSVNVGKGGVNVDTAKPKPNGGTSVNVGKGGVHVNTGKSKPKGGTSVNVGKGGVNVHTGKPKGKSVHVTVPHSPFDYNYAATQTQLNDNPNTALFFLQKNLHPTTKFNIHFVKSSNNAATFLPRDVAESIPFSSKKTEDILNMFEINEDSEKAEIVKNSIRECEEFGIKGEEKRCVTSLESMVDFATSELGNNVEAVSTSTSTEANKETKLQEYEVTSGVRKLTGDNDKVVVCHKQNYPYAVFYCHETGKTEAYFVPLEGVDGSRVKAVAVCHTDTKEWNPKHLAFQVLKVQPGTVPICHFLPEDHVVWVSK